MLTESYALVSVLFKLLVLFRSTSHNAEHTLRHLVVKSKSFLERDLIFSYLENTTT
jgi:hypothetical protein